MGRRLGPRGQLVGTNAGLSRDSGVRTVNWYNLVYDEPGLNIRIEAKLCHTFNERLYAGLHQATSDFSRIETNLASFSMVTSSSSAKRFGWGRSFPCNSPRS